MSGQCPHCGARAPAHALAGRAHACPRCGNPVLAAERAETAAVEPVAPGETGETGEPGEAGEAPESPLAPPPTLPSARRPPWGIAAIALVVLAAAHAGLFALLTAETRRDRAGIVEVEGPSVLEVRAPPEPPPSADDAKALKAYDRQHERWFPPVVLARLELSGRVTTLGTWLALAYAAQAGLVLFVLVKASQRASQRARAPGPSPGRTRARG